MRDLQAEALACDFAFEEAPNEANGGVAIDGDRPEQVSSLALPLGGRVGNISERISVSTSVAWLSRRPPAPLTRQNQGRTGSTSLRVSRGSPSANERVRGMTASLLILSFFLPCCVLTLLFQILAFVLSPCSFEGRLSSRSTSHHVKNLCAKHASTPTSPRLRHCCRFPRSSAALTLERGVFWAMVGCQWLGWCFFGLELVVWPNGIVTDY